MSLGHGASIVRDGLVLHLDAANPKSYSGSGTTWSDLTPNNEDATLVNTPTLLNENQGVMSFDRTTFERATSFSADTYFLSENQSWTVSTFVNVLSNTHAGNGNSGIFCNQKYFTETTAPGPGGFGLAISQLDNYCGMLTHDDGAGTTNSYQTLSTMSIDYGNWENITYVYDSTDTTKYMYAYRNGVLENTASSTSYKWSTTNRTSLICGNTQGGWGDYYDIKMGNLFVYNRALSASEVLRIYESSRGRYGI